MQTTFTQGDRVRSRVTAQGLVEGDLYEITCVSTYATVFGGYVTYYVRPVDSATEAAKQESFPIGNGHLLLEAL